MDIFELFIEENLSVKDMQIVRLFAYVYAHLHAQGFTNWDVESVMSYCKDRNMTSVQRQTFESIYNEAEEMLKRYHERWFVLSNPKNYLQGQIISCSFEESSILIFNWCCLSFYSSIHPVYYQPLFCISGYIINSEATLRFLGECLSTKIENVRIQDTMVTEDDIVNFCYAMNHPNGYIGKFEFDKEIEDFDNLELISKKIIHVIQM